MRDEVTLAPVREDDLPTLERLTNDPEGAGPHEWAGWSDPHLWRHRWTENGLLGSAGGTLMVLQGSDRVGFVGWRQLRTGQISYCWELGVGILPEARGRGCGTRAQQLVIHYLFSHTMVNRIQAVTDIANVAEQRALEKAGFSREGVQRGSRFRDGRWHDDVVYSVLRDEVDLSAGPLSAPRPGAYGGDGAS